MAKITLAASSTGSQTSLHFALYHALDEYERARAEIAKSPPITEETATPENTLLNYQLEQWRVTSLILAAACVEAAANLYLAFKSTPKRFSELERRTFMDKWTTVPKLFVPNYDLPKSKQPYQDLKRLASRRNALMHMKEDVITGGGTISHKGRSRYRAGADEHEFVKRCRTLTERLVKHLGSFDKTDVMVSVGMIAAFAGIYLAAMAKLPEIKKALAESR
jgi:hypothetical protein